MDYGMIRQAVREARDAFEEKFAQTGLSGWPCRSGYLVSRWGNEGKDIPGILGRAGLPCERNLSGVFLVSGGVLERAAVAAVYDKARAAPVPAPSIR